MTKKQLIALYSFLVISGKSFAITENKVIWPLFDMPPNHILKGPIKGQGNVDLLLKFHQKHLQNYSHVNMVMNYLRFFNFAENPKVTVCAIGMFKTPERLQKFYYSVPSYIEMAPEMIVRKADLKKFTTKRKVSLKETLNNVELRGAFAAGRSYSPEVNILIDEYKDEKHVNIHPIREVQLFKMLLNKRIDYSIHASSLINYMTIGLGIEDTYESLIINEFPHYNLGYTVCSKTVTGRAIIDDISVLLLNERSKQEYFEILTKWKDEKTLNRLLKIYNNDFVNRVD